MTDEQLEQIFDTLQGWQLHKRAPANLHSQLLALDGEVRRLRKLEEAVRELVYKRDGRWHSTGEQPTIAAIGRLLEESHAD